MWCYLFPVKTSWSRHESCVNAAFFSHFSCCAWLVGIGSTRWSWCMQVVQELLCACTEWQHGAGGSSLQSSGSSLSVGMGTWLRWDPVATGPQALWVLCLQAMIALGWAGHHLQLCMSQHLPGSGEQQGLHPRCRAHTWDLETCDPESWMC